MEKQKGKNPDLIEANLNFGMATAKQHHCIIQPQILPNLLDHSIKRELESNTAPICIGVILGKKDGKIIDISNCFHVPLKNIEKKSDKDGETKTPEKQEKSQSNIGYNIEPEYLKKIIRFHHDLNDQEAILGIYISSTVIDSLALSVIHHFRDDFLNQKYKTGLDQPIILQFDPTLKNNKLDIKILKLHSFYLEKCPLFSELPYKFNLENFEQTGLDVLFYGQKHCDTMSILNDRRDLSTDDINDMSNKAQILNNRELMLHNFKQLIDNLDECEKYIQDVIDGKQVNDPNIGRQINKCLGQFSTDDMSLLEQMVLTNFKDAIMTNNLAKLQMAQIGLTEKINNLFSQSLNQYILSINQKFQTRQDNLNQSQNTNQDSNQINSSSNKGKKN